MMQNNKEIKYGKIYKRKTRHQVGTYPEYLVITGKYNNPEGWYDAGDRRYDFIQLGEPEPHNGIRPYRVISEVDILNYYSLVEEQQ